MTEPSQKALDYAARKAGFNDFSAIRTLLVKDIVIAHAKTLDELWALKPPKTRGELFAEEMGKRWREGPLSKDMVGSEAMMKYAAQMIDEGWEPKDD